MACFKPIEAFQRVDGSIVFVERGDIRRALRLRCGQCIGCRADRTMDWAIRCYHESSCHVSSVFATLTYDEIHCPEDGSLCYRDFQLFMKRLRRRVGPVRFFVSGEYGDKFLRPHFHACLFGVDFPDRVSRGLSPAGFPVWSSEVLNECWQLGFAVFGSLTIGSAAYVAKYCQKRVTGGLAARVGVSGLKPYERLLASGEVVEVRPEFGRMSLRPGIGAVWLNKYFKDIYERDYVVVDGRKYKPPRYYDNLLSTLDPESAEYMEFKRVSSVDPAARFDSSPARLAVREAVLKARLSTRSTNNME